MYLNNDLEEVNFNLQDKYNIASSISALITAQPYTIDIDGFAIVTIVVVPDLTLPLDAGIYLNDVPITSNYFSYYYQGMGITIPVKKVMSLVTSGFDFYIRIIY